MTSRFRHDPPPPATPLAFFEAERDIPELLCRKGDLATLDRATGELSVIHTAVPVESLIDRAVRLGALVQLIPRAPTHPPRPTRVLSFPPGREHTNRRL